LPQAASSSSADAAATPATEWREQHAIAPVARFTGEIIV
jgi:hypothetical protein